MRRILLLMILLLLPAAVFAQQMRTVTQVIDGDTLVLDGSQTVVLLGAQVPGFAPEVKKDGKVKPLSSAGVGWADRAKQFTTSMVMGKQVWLEYDKVQTDDQGRTLAYVFFKLDSAKTVGGGGEGVLLTSGTYMLNQLLLQYGFATSGSSYPFKYRAQFDQLQNQAQQQRAGLWQSNF